MATHETNTSTRAPEDLDTLQARHLPILRAHLEQAQTQADDRIFLGALAEAVRDCRSCLPGFDRHFTQSELDALLTADPDIPAVTVIKALKTLGLTLVTRPHSDT